MWIMSSRFGFLLLWIALSSQTTAGCATGPKTLLTSSKGEIALSGGHCGSSLPAIHFEETSAVRVVVTNFYGSSRHSSNCRKNASEQIAHTLQQFKEEMLHNPLEFDLEIPENILQIERVPCVVDSHSHAEELAETLDVDVVIWGEAYCNPTSPFNLKISTDVNMKNARIGIGSQVSAGNVVVNAPKPYTITPSATLTWSDSVFRTTISKGIDLKKIPHLTLPVLHSTKPFRLIEFALGLRLYEMKHYWLAARFFHTAAEAVLANERNTEMVDELLGEMYLYLPDYDLSLKYNTRALERSRGSSKEATLHNRIGRALFKKGNLKSALKHFRRAQSLSEKFFGREHPDTARNLTDIGDVLEVQGEHVAALENYYHALSIVEHSLGENHPLVSDPLISIGRTLLRQGLLDDANRHLQRAHTVRGMAVGPNHPQLAPILLLLGELALAYGDADRAIGLIHHAKSLGNSTIEPDLVLALARAQDLAEMTSACNKLLQQRKKYSKDSLWRKALRCQFVFRPGCWAVFADR